MTVGLAAATATIVATGPNTAGAAAPESSTASAAAEDGYGDGRWVVGDEIAPGRYQSAGPDGSAPECSWWRSGPNGAPGNVADGPAIADIAADDESFSSHGCAPWMPYVGPAEPATSFGPGAVAVGTDVVSGRYQAAQPGQMCVWTAVSAFTDADEDVLDEGLGAGPQFVDLADGTGFASQDCGEWVRLDGAGETPLLADGVHLVGTDIAPGRYVAQVQSYCSWRRLSGTSGSSEEIVAIDVLRDPGQTVVDILADDVAFESRGCGMWQPYVAPAEPLTSFTDGEYVVGSDILPGRYRASGATDDCFWLRRSDLNGDDIDGTIHGNYGLDEVTVDIAASDVGFKTSDCGTWQLVEPAPAGVALDADRTAHRSAR